jgi:histidinol-phosphate phosphatase family protein
MQQFQHYSTLFIDRDGVINTRKPTEYVTCWEDFHFEKLVLEALEKLSKYFQHIVIVTNQAGIAKGIISENDLKIIHHEMITQIASAGGRVDKVYYCPHLAFAKCTCRKPASGMAFSAKADFPNIDFYKSIIVGDSLSDMEFGKKLGMATVLVEGKTEEYRAQQNTSVSLRVRSLWHFSDLFI